MTLGGAAVRAIREALEGPDTALQFRAAVKALELLGCGDPPPIGPTDPAEVAAEFERAEIDRLRQADTDRILGYRRD